MKRRWDLLNFHSIEGCHRWTRQPFSSSTSKDLTLNFCNYLVTLQRMVHSFCPTPFLSLSYLKLRFTTKLSHQVSSPLIFLSKFESSDLLQVFVEPLQYLLHLSKSQLSCSYDVFVKPLINLSHYLVPLPWEMTGTSLAFGRNRAVGLPSSRFELKGVSISYQGTTKPPP
jgi:hypothetical protein